MKCKYAFSSIAAVALGWLFSGCTAVSNISPADHKLRAAPPAPSSPAIGAHLEQISLPPGEVIVEKLESSLKMWALDAQTAVTIDTIVLDPRGSIAFGRELSLHEGNSVSSRIYFPARLQRHGLYAVSFFRSNAKGAVDLGPIVFRWTKFGWRERLPGSWTKNDRQKYRLFFILALAGRIPSNIAAINRLLPSPIKLWRTEKGRDGWAQLLSSLGQVRLISKKAETRRIKRGRRTKRGGK